MANHCLSAAAGRRSDSFAVSWHHPYHEVFRHEAEIPAVPRVGDIVSGETEEFFDIVFRTAGSEEECCQSIEEQNEVGA